MAHAFLCDRCKQFTTGKPDGICIIGKPEAKGLDISYELCKSCYIEIRRELNTIPTQPESKS